LQIENTDQTNGHGTVASVCINYLNSI
jgi:hypothetical protein